MTDQTDQELRNMGRTVRTFFRGLSETNGRRQKAIEEYLEGADLQGLMDRIESAPLQIENQQAVTQNLRESVGVAQQELDNAEAEIQSLVTAEIDPNTRKKAFSNDSARKAETAVRCMKDDDYKSALANLREAENAQFAAQSELERIQNAWSGAKHVCDLHGNLLRAISSY